MSKGADGLDEDEGGQRGGEQAGGGAEEEKKQQQAMVMEEQGEGSVADSDKEDKDKEDKEDKEDKTEEEEGSASGGERDSATPSGDTATPKPQNRKRFSISSDKAVVAVVGREEGLGEEEGLAVGGDKIEGGLAEKPVIENHVSHLLSLNMRVNHL